MKIVAYWPVCWLMAIILLMAAPGGVISQTIADPEKCDPGRLREAAQTDCPESESTCCAHLPGPDETLDLPDLLAGATGCTNSDQHDLCDDAIRAKYNCYLVAWQEALETHRDTQKPSPLVKLQLQREIEGIGGRRAEIQGITTVDCIAISCESCRSMEDCQERCRNNRSKMEVWRNRYKNTMRGNQYLDCDSCLAHLDTYYREQKQLFQENRLDKKQVYTKEHIDLMWGLLFCLSHASKKAPKGSTCLERAQEILPNAMLPFVLPPDELITLLSDKFRRTGGLSPTEVREILANKERVFYMIDVLVELMAKSGKVPDMPPAELANILTHLIDDNLHSLSQIPVDQRLKLFSATMGTLSPTDLTAYWQRSNEDREALAHFMVTAIQKADKHTLEVLEVVGLEHEDLAKLIAAYLGERHKDDEKAFYRQMLKLFDTDTIIFNELISERFFKMGDEDQKRIIKDKNLQKQVKRFIKNIYDVYPKIDDQRRELPSPYLTSFLMPGYPITYYEKSPGLAVKAWNYSNFAILGASLAAEFLFINSDYETETYYQAGVLGAYLFAANGLIGALHAYWYDPPNVKKERRAGIGLSISGNHLMASCQIRF